MVGFAIGSAVGAVGGLIYTSPMRRLISVRPLPGYRLALAFDDGVEGVADLSDLAGHGVFTCWLQSGEFEKVTIGDSGEAVWASGVDQCPDALYLRVTGKAAAQLFPSLERGDHDPPHIHAEYGDFRALIDISSLAVIGGALPPRALGLTVEWATMHKDELQDLWALARSSQPLHRLDPLP